MKLKFLLSAAMAGGMLTAVSAPALADVNPYLGQVTLTSITFCPRTTAEANGAILPISSNEALFSLYGCTFGGDCRTTFALPDLRGRTPVNIGNGITWGQQTGGEYRTLTVDQMPSHRHNVEASNRPGTLNSPSNADLAEFAGGAINGYSTDAPGAITMESNAIGTTGGNQSFPIRQPFLAMRWCVVTQGIFPPRN